MANGFIESQLGFVGLAEYKGFHEGWEITDGGKKIVQLALAEHDRDPNHLKHLPAIQQFFEERENAA